jgi:folate-binding protein YgfZ
MHISPPSDFGDPLAEETALATEAGLSLLTDRAQIALRGADRASFLHNLCTNDIKKLRPGEGCEALLLNAQGKTLAHLYVFAEDEQLVLDAVAAQIDFIRGHLDRYLIREKVEIVPLVDQVDLLFAGARIVPALSMLEIAPLPAEHGSHINAKVFGVTTSIRKVDLAGADSWLLSSQRDELEKVTAALTGVGLRPCGTAAVEAARIAAGAPLWGREISEANLPQELNRDAKQINFTKGCYLGQETVARIDALGHVNRLLVGLRAAGRDVPEIGAELQSEDGKTIGTVTSATFSHRFGTAIALGYVRRALALPGTVVQSTVGPMTVSALPMA